MLAVIINIKSILCGIYYTPRDVKYNFQYARFAQYFTASLKSVVVHM